MQDINRESKRARGSSPPFQESERWIDDGATGVRWVKMASIGSQKGDDRLIEQYDQQSAGLTQSEDEGRLEDEGGKCKSAPPLRLDAQPMS